MDGKETTNSAAERALGLAAMWRKGNYGAFSEGGSQFAERTLTVAATARQQGRALLPLLFGALTPQFRGSHYSC